VRATKVRDPDRSVPLDVVELDRSGPCSARGRAPAGAGILLR
jgi:hypothetical protein